MGPAGRARYLDGTAFVEIVAERAAAKNPPHPAQLLDAFA